MGTNLYDKLSQIEKTAYNNYKANLDINCNIRNGNITNPDIEILDRIILRSQLTENIQLYRAARKDTVLQYIAENIYVNPEFLSTTNNTSVLWKFLEDNYVVLIIDCCIGINYIDMELNPIAEHDECEILLGRNLTFKITENNLLTDEDEVKNFIDSLGFSFKPIKPINTVRIIKMTLGESPPVVGVLFP